MAIIGLAVDDTFALACRIPADVVHQKQIKVAIVVHIEPRGAHRPAPFIVDAGLLRNVDERAVASIAIESDTVKTTDQQVEAPVAIEVAGGSTKVIIRARQACARGDVFKTQSA